MGPQFAPLPPVPTLPSGDAPNLFDVWGTSTRDIWVVGEGSSVFRWDGARWTRAYTPTGTEAADLVSIWGRDDEDVYVVGDDGQILHYFTPQGALAPAWIREPTPTRANLNAVHGHEDQVWAAGNAGTLLRRDPDQGWTAVDADTQENLNGLWIGGRNEGLAVGNLGVITQYNGRRWRRQRVSGLTAALQQVAGTARDRLYIVGLDGTLLRAEGNRWTQVEAVPSVYLRDVAVTGDRTLWAVGWSGAVIATDGAALTPFFDFTDRRLEGIWGAEEPLAETSSTGATTRDVFHVVGVSGTVLRGP